jgi:uncharacterized integral membrane protein
MVFKNRAKPIQIYDFFVLIGCLSIIFIILYVFLLIFLRHNEANVSVNAFQKQNQDK